MLASRMVRAEPRRLPCAIFLMKRGTSMCVGQAAMQGASKQYRQRLASVRADCWSKGGWSSGKRATSSELALWATVNSPSSGDNTERKEQTLHKAARYPRNDNFVYGF